MRWFRRLFPWPIRIPLGYLLLWLLAWGVAHLWFPEQQERVRLDVGLVLLAAGILHLGYRTWQWGVEAWQRRQEARARPPLPPGPAAMAKEQLGSQLRAIGGDRRPAADPRSSPGDDLCVVLLVGPSGGGKTQLLAASGLPVTGPGREPLKASGPTPSPTAWRVGSRLLVVELPGRYLDRRTEEEWEGVIDALREFRPQRPIDAVLVAMPLPGLVEASTGEIQTQGQEFQRILGTAGHRLHLRFPVHLALTRTDGLAGFTTYFANMDAGERDQHWGISLEGGTADPAVGFRRGFPLLQRRVENRRPQRLSRTQSATERQHVLCFAGEFSRCEVPIATLLAGMAEGVGEEGPRLAGVWWTSARSGSGGNGQALASLAKWWGMTPAESPPTSGRDRSWFVSPLFNSILPSLRNTARGSSAVLRQAQREVRRRLTLTATALVTVGVLALAGMLSARSEGRRLEALAEAAVLRPAGSPARVGAIFRLADEITRPGGARADRARPLAPTLEPEGTGLPSGRVGTLGLLTFPGRVLNQAEAKTRLLLAALIRIEVMNPLAQSVQEELRRLISSAGGSPDSSADSPGMTGDQATIFSLVADGVELCDLAKTRPPGGKERERAVDLLAARFEAPEGGQNPGTGTLRASLVQIGVEELDLWPSIDPAACQAARDWLAQRPAPGVIYGDLVRSVAGTGSRRFAGFQSTFLLSGGGEVSPAFHGQGCLDFHNRVDEEVKKRRNLPGRTSGDDRQVTEAVKQMYQQNYQVVWTRWLDGLRAGQVVDVSQASAEVERLFVGTPGDVVGLLVWVGQGREIPPPAAGNLLQEAGAAVNNAANTFSGTNPATLCQTLMTPYAPSHELAKVGGQQRAVYDDFQAKMLALKDRLSRLATGEAGQRNLEAVRLVKDTLDGAGELAAAHLATAALLQRSDPQTRPVLVRLLQEGLMRQTWQAILVAAGRALNQDWDRRIFQPWSLGVRGRFPFNKMGSEPAELGEVTTLLGKEGQIQLFLASSVDPLLSSTDFSPRVWQTWGGIPFSGEFLGRLKRMKEVLALVGGGKMGATSRLTLTPKYWECSSSSACGKVGAVEIRVGDASPVKWEAARELAPTRGALFQPHSFDVPLDVKVELTVYTGLTQDTKLCVKRIGSPASLWGAFPGSPERARRAGLETGTLRLPMASGDCASIPLTVVMGYEEGPQGPLKLLDQLQLDLPEKVVTMVTSF